MSRSAGAEKPATKNKGLYEVNYYTHHIGDYLKDTSHLSALEDGIYRRMLDLYYVSEKPLPLNIDGLCRLVRAKTREEKKAVDTVLEEFFVRCDVGFRQTRADRELLRAQEKSGKAKASANVRWHCDGNANAMRTHCEGNAPNTQQPTTNNQYPKKDIVGQGPDLKPLAVEILNFLNAKTGRDYQPVAANLEMILARLKEGSSVDDLRAVVAKKCREWTGDEKMNQYLRPKTLFNRTNFAQYRGELVDVN